MQSTAGCFPELCFLYFSVALVFVGLRKQFKNNFVFSTWACAAGFNNNNTYIQPNALIIFLAVIIVSVCVYLQNFVTILSELSRGSTAEKLRWAFSLYDINGDGCISRDELMDIVTAVYSLLGRNATPTVEESTTREHVDRIFEVTEIKLKSNVSFLNIIRK